MQTPWGKSDDDGQSYGPGVTFYSTPGHGGFRVLARVRAQWPAALRDFPSTASGWYEEDCEWAIVVLAMPERFSAEMQQQAADNFNSTFRMIERAAGEADDNPPGYWARSLAQYRPVAEWLAAHTTPTGVSV